MILPYGREWCVHKLTLGLRTAADVPYMRRQFAG
jgi:hypothetical protein